MKAIEKAVKQLGGPSGMAAALGIQGTNPQMTVRQWVKRGVPAARVLDIERATKGKVTRHELRPDLYPRNG